MPSKKCLWCRKNPRAKNGPCAECKAAWKLQPDLGNLFITSWVPTRYRKDVRTVIRMMRDGCELHHSWMGLWYWGLRTKKYGSHTYHEEGLGSINEWATKAICTLITVDRWDCGGIIFHLTPWASRDYDDILPPMNKRYNQRRKPTKADKALAKKLIEMSNGR